MKRLSLLLSVHKDNDVGQTAKPHIHEPTLFDFTAGEGRSVQLKASPPYPINSVWTL